MKITLLTTLLNGGAGIACLRLAQALQRLGHDPQVLVAELPQPTPLVAAAGNRLWYKTRYYAERLRFFMQAASKEVRFAFSPSTWGADLSQHPAIQRADVLHLHWINHGFLTIEQLGRLGATGKPLVWTLHDMWAFTGGCHHNRGCEGYLRQCGNCSIYLKNPHPTDLSHQVWARKQRAFAQMPMQVITCSDWLGQHARRSSLMQAVSVRTIPNPIDTQTFAPQDKAAARAAFGLPPNAKLVLFIAANVMNRYKGFPNLVEAMRIFKQQHPDTQNLRFVVVGKAETEALEALPYPFHYLGTLSGAANLARIYNAVDLFVTPSLEENLPNTVMESLACGTPVLAFATGGIPEMVQHQQSGYIANYLDANDLAAGLAWILQADAAAMGTQGRHWAEANYAPEVVAQRYLQAYADAGAR